ncbi:Terpene cyclase 6 [Fusarium equiseti]|uniref:Terpene synthase n=1 Tax=Fusarium equiseti TaxID=61235 RepID=A0ABQ8R7J2_FUSEQ|nr:Terpene cyclase 6 [Fusarium equiseti]
MPHKDVPLRPVKLAFDPVGSDTLGVPDLDFASLFREEKVKEDDPLVLNPQDMGVPWNTSLPWTRQSKHWAYAEAEGYDLCNAISLDKASERGTLPMELMDERRKWKIDELVEDALSCCVYLYPTSSPKRLALLTQSVLLLFLHDDVIERGDTQNDTTVVDEFLSMAPKNRHLKKFWKEVLECDPILGPDLLYAIHVFVRDGRVKSPFKQDKYATLADYMLYRRNDVGKTFMIAAIRFGCGVHQTREELAPLDEIADLYVRHSILINDLYSYDKEVHEVKTIHASIVNAVAVTEDLLSVSPNLAKTITRQISFDMEKEFYDMCEKFMLSPSINDRQRAFITGLFDALTGNIFHSATLSRYVRHGENPLPCKC